MMYGIEIKLFGNNWMARHEDPEVQALFKDDWLPTAFLSETSGEDVVECLQKLNPERKVYLTK